MRSLLASMAVFLVLPVTASGQIANTGDGSKTGDGSTPFTGISQAPEANLFLGSSGAQVAIELPSGRQSITPQLTLHYSSSGGPGPYGYGWDLSIPRLQRTAKHGVLPCSQETESMRNDLVLTLPGASIECTLQSNGSCLPRVQESFIRINRSVTNGTEFKATDKSGITYTFGGPGAVTTSWAMNASFGGDIAATGGTTTQAFDTASTPCKYISSWALRRVEDPNGNYMEYRYVRNGNMLYPHSIVYGANAIAAPSSHPYTVYFLWQTRGENLVTARGGFPATMSYRLQRINVIYNGNTLVRAYQMNYDTSRVGRQTFLKSVRLLGSNGTAAVRADGAPADNLYLYHVAPAGFDATWQSVSRPSFTSGFPNRLRVSTEDNGNRRDVIDMNGDGFVDLVDADTDNGCMSGGLRHWRVFFGSPAGFSTSPVTWRFPTQPNTCRISYINSATKDTRTATVDMTGDGIPDYVDAEVKVWGTQGGQTIRYWTVYPGRYSPSTSSWGFGDPVFWTFAPGQGASLHHVRRVGTEESNLFVTHDLVDINGDGLLDLVRTCWPNCPGGQTPEQWDVYLNNGKPTDAGAGFLPKQMFTAQQWMISWIGMAYVYRPIVASALADMNGDGLPDQVYGGGVVCLNEGTRIGTCSEWATGLSSFIRDTAVNFGHPPQVQDVVVDLIDMNGDGLPDIVETAGWTPTNKFWNVRLNRGDSFEATTIQWPAPRGQIRDADEDGIATTYDIFDINGDGLVDFVDFYNKVNAQGQPAESGNPGATYAIYHSAAGAWTANGSGVAARVTGAKPDLLEVAENGVGAVTTLRYRPSTAWDNDGSDFVLEEDSSDTEPIDLPFNVWTVTEITTRDAMCVGLACVDSSPWGHQLRQKFRYENGRYDPIDREFRGFAMVETTTYDVVGTPSRGGVTFYHQTSALAGKVQQTWLYDATNGGKHDTQPIGRKDNVWECYQISSGQTFTSTNCPAYPGVAGGPPSGDLWVRLKQVDEYTYSNLSPLYYRRMQTVNQGWHQCPDGKYYGNVRYVRQGAVSGSPQRHTETNYACIRRPM